MTEVRVEQLVAPAGDADLRGLAEVTCACVDDGASIGFLAGVDVDRAAEWWRALLAEPGLRCLLARDHDGRVVGTVSIRLDQPETGQHRADVTKLLVRPETRRRGIAAALMTAVEAVAAAEGRTVLLLDTESDSAAEALYRRLGWIEFGRLDDHAARPDGVLSGSTFFVKRLASS